MNKKLFIGIVVLAAVATVFIFVRGDEDTWLCQGGQWVKHGMPSAPMPTSRCGETSPLEINFDKTGHFAKDTPGLKPDTWYLVYEEPGAPALTAELRFTASSACSYGPTTGQCPDVLLLSSALTHVRGVRDSEGVVNVVSAVSP